MTTQLVFGLMAGEKKEDPYAVGDVVMTKHFGRVVILVCSDNIHGGVFICARQDGTGECIVLEREIQWRSR